MNSPASNNSGTAPLPPAQAKHPVEKFVAQIPGLSNGDRAQLRRIYLTERYEADGVIVGLLHCAGIDATLKPETFRPWRLLAHCAALLSGTGKVGRPTHAIGRKLGAALKETGLTEIRLLRLTSTRGAELDAQVIRAMRMMAQRKAEPVNLLTLFDLIGNDPERSEVARRLIAQQYYAAAL